MENRTEAAAVQMTSNTWWVTGGSNGSSLLATTEMFTAGQGFAPYVDLPQPKYYHNLVKVNETHIMLLGGKLKLQPIEAAT